MDTEFHQRMIQFGSFPKGERPECYQEYWDGGKWQPGQREVVARAAILGFNPQAGESVLELGCQTGGFLQLACLNGASWVHGMDVDEDYIGLAKELATRNHLPIRFEIGDITLPETISRVLQQLPPRGLDHLLLLSLGKHVGSSTLFSIVDRLQARHTYIETNAISSKNPCPYQAEILARNGKRVGLTIDRNDRAVYVIHRK